MFIARAGGFSSGRSGGSESESECADGLSGGGAIGVGGTCAQRANPACDAGTFVSGAVVAETDANGWLVFGEFFSVSRGAAFAAFWSARVLGAEEASDNSRDENCWLSSAARDS
jgi:hypothetical protein